MLKSKQKFKDPEKATRTTNEDLNRSKVGLFWENGRKNEDLLMQPESQRSDT